MVTQLQQKYCKELEHSFSSSIDKMKTEMGAFQGHLKATHNVLSSYLLIERQDEQDRNDIALVGVREHHRDEIKEHREHIIYRKERSSPV
jgi:hypothetical protein